MFIPHNDLEKPDKREKFIAYLQEIAKKDSEKKNAELEMNKCSKPEEKSSKDKLLSIKVEELPTFFDKQDQKENVIFFKMNLNCKTRKLCIKA